MQSALAENFGDDEVMNKIAWTVASLAVVSAATLGWAYYKMGSFKLAISQLEESVRTEPGNALYQYHLGMAYLAARRFDAAGRVLQKALAVEPASPYQAQIREALGKVSKGLN